ncbi:hypothetical protein DC498_17730 [Terrimonas sp.]|uniref:hypothetical protein n=1 Tax=Terrimonas sp. TaxID=1914338 RepID=UPI000D51D099|nr:hypothetical protein [Terrimonas sp.]PVD50813.1 hypothetical protein DC498_17730 [Terrimonas sp.]
MQNKSKKRHSIPKLFRFETGRSHLKQDRAPSYKKQLNELSQLPGCMKETQKLQKAVDNFFMNMPASNIKRLCEMIDDVTQDALYSIDDSGGNTAGITFKLMTGIKELLVTLDPYAENK